jgi:gamma-glutamyl-gamma-aminobutyrate hydrolase PuuD
MSGCECKPDAKRKRDSAQPQISRKMKKPWIGIPTRYHEKSEYIGQIRHYLDAVIWAGGLPLLIPTTSDREITREFVEQVQGVLLPGSPNDIDPGKYGEALPLQDKAQRRET